MLKRKSISFWDDQLRLKAHEVDLHKSFMLGVVWAEKIHFVRRAVEENPFASSKFIWCDAGIMRTDESAVGGFLFGCNDSVLSDNKFHLLEVGPVTPVDSKWWDPHHPEEVRFGGGIFGAHADVWQRIIPLYEGTLDEMAADGVCVFKDQVVWANCVRKEPSLFHIHRAHKEWFHLLRLWSVPPSNDINTFIINLDTRRDRWDEMRTSWSLRDKRNVFRFPALRHRKPSPWLGTTLTHGCAASHLSIITANPRTCLVLEDDAEPRSGDVSLESLLDMLRGLEDAPLWHFVNFGTSTVTGLHGQTFGSVRNFNDSFWQTKITSTTHAIGYSARMQTIVRPATNIVWKTFFTGEQESNIDFVFGSGLVDLGEDVVQLIPRSGSICRQRASFSDISNMTTDYTYMFDMVDAQLARFQHAWMPVALPIVVEMQGGLGNQLFMAAAGMSFSRSTGRPLALLRTPFTKNPHSDVNYMDTVFSRFPQIGSVPETWYTLCGNFEDVKRVSFSKVPQLRGYFQNAAFATREFADMLTLPPCEPMEDDDAVMIHIRGGDYLTLPLHAVNLLKFRQACIEVCSRRTRALVFTNDKEHANKCLKFSGIRATIVESSSELETFAQMKNGSAPLICSNSTFSWWAGALSRLQNLQRLVFLPKEWYAPTVSRSENEKDLFDLPGAIVL